MGKYLVPAAMVLSFVSLAASALTIAFVTSHPAWWVAALHLAVTGGFVPAIYAVNVRIVPVFARRSWRNPGLIRVQIVAALAGAWLLFGARLAELRIGELLGLATLLGASLLFSINLMQLFRQPVGSSPSLPLPYPDQATVDRIATKFTRISGLYLLIGLTVGLVTELWPPDSGRWDLVWAHSMLLGFFLCMVNGVSYHVLSRWTNNRWRHVRAIRLHFGLVTIGLPVMLAALVFESDLLFEIAGPMQAVALGLFLYSVIPVLSGLPWLTRAAWYGAATFLAVGVFLGATFAAHPVYGVRLRFAHAELNVYAWGGLLVSGMGYYLAPRLASSPLRWPRLAAIQLALLGSGVVVSASAFAARGYGHDPGIALSLGQAMQTAAFATFALIIGATFRGRRGQAVSLAAPRPGGIQLTRTRNAASG